MSIRTKQVESEVIHHLTQIITKNIELENSFITITSASITPDLRTIKIFISVIPENKRGSALEKLNKRAGFLQKELKSKIRFYTIPKLQFSVDNGEIKRIKVSEALSGISNDKDLDIC